MSSQSIETTLPEEDLGELRGIIKQFLSKYKYLYEFRIQKLVFYAEIYSIDNYLKRLSNSEWQPYIYGSFSKDVRAALHQIDVPQQTVYKNGDDTIKYLNRGLSTTEQDKLNETKTDIIDQVHKQTKSQGTQELAQFSKEHWIFQETDYEAIMSFEKYKDYIKHKDKDKRPLFDSDSPDIEPEMLESV